MPGRRHHFPKDEDILNYDGEIVNKQTLDERYAKHTAPYAVEISKPSNVYEDGAIERSAMACVTNCSPEGTRANCRLATDIHRNHNTGG